MENKIIIKETERLILRRLNTDRCDMRNIVTAIGNKDSKGENWCKRGQDF